MTIYVDQTEYSTMECCTCHMLFGVTTAFKQKRLNDRAYFYCPTGHQQHFTGPSEETKLRDQLKREQQMRESAQLRADQAKSERDEARRMHQRMRVRIVNGVCPCCNRTFQNLLRHMQTEHSAEREQSLKVWRHAFGMSQRDLAKELDVNVTYVSNYERQQPVPVKAKARMEAWVKGQAPQG